MQKIRLKVRKITFKKVKEMIHMIKQIAWNTFKNTGNIDSYLEFVEVENLEKQIQAQLNQTIKHNLGENIGLDTNKWVE